MSEHKLNQFLREVSVAYRGECYLVRDNGAVCRQRRKNQRKRPLDNVWTFGAFTVRNGYRKVCSTPVHRIVATAFCGVPPSRDHVVDHIDTNRLNNKPNNLRWVTRQENILDNPKTLRRIVKKWGSVEGLLNDPNPAEKANPITNRSWMIQALFEKMHGDKAEMESLTPLATQRDWKTPSEFPMCPDNPSENSLQNYVSRLKHGATFSRNRYGESVVDTADINQDGTCLSVICMIDGGLKDYALAKVTIEDGKFVHTSVSTYFTYDGAEKSHYALIGKPWEEPDGYQGCIDDYC